MTIKKLLIGFISLISLFVLAACTGDNEGTSPDESPDTEMESEANEDNMETESDPHANMDHSSSGEVPEDIANAEDPTYTEGSEAVIQANHMGGMDEAVATIDGSYDTTVYTVTYTPTTGGETVEDHKWVIHEEIENAEEQPYELEDEIVLEADHMEGMKGATATIDSAEDTTVYMVSYTDTETGEEVENHKWVTENELTPVE
ncbi:YdhK family protein [Oceanobacillus kimchii]|uniref:YdhK family protein n=1 Tax=Bacillaceae TaxID=186817 RepID=UPI001CD593F0|nr:MULTISPECIES: YdhK family protein [Bacillaceae]MCA1024995.1 YdhK family protein [Cytobacillus kochii]MCT1577863.1 YdhK family protein [Oceanobacillus kimchii]MCT2136851.1 YdhK family protein [Oceanobacillus kimchii]